MRRRVRAFVAAAVCMTAAAAQAQQPGASTYPDHLVRIVVPFPAGGTADALPRIVAERLRERWHQPIVVENRSGAGGNIGAAAVAAADPDGYTLFATPPGPLAINAFLYKQMPYDPAALEPVIVLAEVPNVLAVRATFPAKTFQELLDYAKAHPGKINYASQGRGTTSHLSAEMFQAMAKLKMAHVPYRGSAPALVDLTAGAVDLAFDNIASTLSLHNAGKIRILAVGSPERIAVLPDMPTIRELGLAEFQSVTWYAVAAPAKTPAAIVRRINEAIDEILKMPDVRNHFQAIGAQPVGGSPQRMAKLIAAERRRWGDVVKTANIHPE